MKWLHMIRDVFWPRRLKCLCCDEYSERGALCSTCEKALMAMRLSPLDAGEGNVRSVYRYDGAAKDLVLLLKEEGVADAAAVLAEKIAETIRTMEIPPDAVLTWVTMPELRRRKRYIDHGRRLCEETAMLSGMKCRQLFRREGMLHTQRGLNRMARLRNLRGSIVCRERVNVPVVIIDDVLTTGATVSACADALIAAGAPGIYAVTATKVVMDCRNRI